MREGKYQRAEQTIPAGKGMTACEAWSDKIRGNQTISMKYGGAAMNMVIKQGWWRILPKCLILFLALVLLWPVSSPAEETVRVNWLGRSFTPVYYEEYPNSRLRLRVKCDSTPMAEIYNHRKEIQLVWEDNTTVYPADDIVIMEEYLDGLEGDRVTEFFDAVFEIPGSINGDFSKIAFRFGEEGELLQPLRGGENAGSCVFQTDSGAYVVNIFSRDAADQIKEICADAFQNGDIQLYLEESTNNLRDQYYASHFLNDFDFSSLRLTTTLPIGYSLEADQVTELALLKYNAYLPVFKNVKKLTLNESTAFPDNLTEIFPALEEISLYINSTNADNAKVGFMGQNSRPVNVSSTAERLNIIKKHSDGLPADPDFLIWLEAQRIAVPGLTVNGIPAGGLDLEAGMDENHLAQLRSAKHDAKLYRLFTHGKAQETTLEDVPNKKAVVVVVDMYEKFEVVSTDNKAKAGSPIDMQTLANTGNASASSRDFSVIGADHLATEPDEADLAVFIYPVLTVVGKYGVSFDAYSCDTRIMIVDMETETLLVNQSVALRQPPKSTKLGTGLQGLSGTYEVDMAIKEAARILE